MFTLDLPTLTVLRLGWLHAVTVSGFDKLIGLLITFVTSKSNACVKNIIWSWP